MAWALFQALLLNKRVNVGNLFNVHMTLVIQFSRPALLWSRWGVDRALETQSRLLVFNFN